MPFPDDSLPANVLDAARRGNTIEAIKLLRESTGLGLKEAKDAIDAYARGNSLPAATSASAVPIPASVAEALRRGNKIEAIKLLREQAGLGLKEAKDAVEASGYTTDMTMRKLSPGEVPRSGGRYWLLMACAAAGAAVYYFFRSPG